MSEFENSLTCSEIRGLLIELKKQIDDEYRCSDDPEDTIPGMCVTIGSAHAISEVTGKKLKRTGAWSWQTGDNSYTGGAYGFPYWGVVSLYRDSNCRDLARDCMDQILCQMMDE